MLPVQKDLLSSCYVMLHLLHQVPGSHFQLENMSRDQ